MMIEPRMINIVVDPEDAERVLYWCMSCVEVKRLQIFWGAEWIVVISSIIKDWWNFEVEHCDWQNVRLSEIWNRMSSDSQKVDQASGSLLEYKNVF